MHSAADPDAKAVCSFCGKDQDQVRKMVSGPNVMICDECIDLCNDIIAEGCVEEAVDHQSATTGVNLQCGLCHFPVNFDSGFVLIPDRGPLCLACVDAVRSVLDEAEEEGVGSQGK